MRFEHVGVPVELETLTRKDSPNGRLYVTPSGLAYPSVTTILSEYSRAGIAKWRKKVGDSVADHISNTAKDKGEMVHSYMEDYLNNKPLDYAQMSIMMKFRISQMLPDVNRINRIHLTEKALYSHKLKIAGTPDCIGEYNGKLSIIDFKTSDKLKRKQYIRNYFMQCTAYSKMYEELTGIKIDQMVILICVDDPMLCQVFVEPISTEYETDLYKYIDHHYNNRPLQQTQLVT